MADSKHNIIYLSAYGIHGVLMCSLIYCSRPEAYHQRVLDRVLVATGEFVRSPMAAVLGNYYVHATQACMPRLKGSNYHVLHTAI